MIAFTDNDKLVSNHQTCCMSSNPASCLKAWRNRQKLTLDQVAAATGMTKATLSRLENGKIEWKGSTLTLLAPVYGADDPIDLLRPPFFGRVLLVGTVAADGGVVQIDNIIDYVDPPPGATGPMEALRVEGASMFPELQPGDIVYYDPEKRERPDAFLNKLVVLETRAGDLRVKYLRRGSSPDVFDLVSHAEPVATDIPVARAARVVFVDQRGRE